MSIRHLIEYLLLVTVIGGPYAPLHLDSVVTLRPEVRPPALRSEVRPQGVRVSAESAIVVDAASGKTLFVKNADEPRSIASIVKLMSVMLALEQVADLEQRITISDSDIGNGQGAVFRLGDKVSLRELVFASLVVSANDAVRALVRSTGFEEAVFVKLMNERARSLEMFATKFVEPTGLDPANRATARNLATLLHAASEVPLIREAASTIVFRASGSRPKSQYLINTNLLLEKLLGEVVLGKTGTLEEAGFCLGSIIRRNGHGISIIVLGSENHWSRFSDVEILANWTFNQWIWE